MNPVLPPFLFLFDISALLSGKTREWQIFSRLGDCFLPRGVLQELEFLSSRAPEPDVEQAAREFMRFYPNSHWHETTSIASHPGLKPAAGAALSGRSRATLAVAQAAYGLARNHPEAMVVLVANDQGLLNKVRSLEVSNLSGIPLAAFMQWVRTQRRPQAVMQQLQMMRSQMGEVAPAAVSSRSKPLAPTRSTSAGATPVRSTSARSAPVRSIPTASAITKRSKAARRPPQRFNFSQFISQLITLAVLITMGLAAWRVINPVSFNQFWQQLPFSKQQTNKG
jgi:hypothetical protein